MISQILKIIATFYLIFYLNIQIIKSNKIIFKIVKNYFLLRNIIRLLQRNNKKLKSKNVNFKQLIITNKTIMKMINKY